MAVGLLLRLLNLAGQSFDGDELFTAWYAHSGLHEMLSNVAKHENTPFPYYALVWLWAHLFGHGEAALRSFSVVIGAGTVPVAAAAARVLAGRRIAAATAVLVAVNPLMIWYSQEARSYALFAFMSALALLLFARAINADRPPEAKALRWWALWSTFALAVNYFAVFFIAAQALWMLWYPWRTGDREGVWRELRALTAPMAMGIVLIPLALYQRHHSQVGDIAGVALSTRAAEIPKAFLIGYEVPAKVVVTLAAGALAVLASSPVIRADGRVRTAATVAAFARGPRRPPASAQTAKARQHPSRPRHTTASERSGNPRRRRPARLPHRQRSRCLARVTRTPSSPQLARCASETDGSHRRSDAS